MVDLKSPYTVEGWKLFILEDLIPILLSLKKFEVIREKIIRGEIDKKLLLEILLSEKEKEDEIPASEVIWKVLGIRIFEDAKKGIKNVLARKEEIKEIKESDFEKNDVCIFRYYRYDKDYELLEKLKKIVKVGIYSFELQEEIKNIYNLSKNHHEDLVNELLERIERSEEVMELIKNLKNGGEKFIEEIRSLLEKLVNLLPISNEFSYFITPFIYWNPRIEGKGYVWESALYEFFEWDEIEKEIIKKIGITNKEVKNLTTIVFKTLESGYGNIFGYEFANFIRYLSFLVAHLLDDRFFKALFPIENNIDIFEEWKKEIKEFIEKNEDVKKFIGNFKYLFSFSSYFPITPDSPHSFKPPECYVYIPIENNKLPYIFERRIWTSRSGYRYDEENKFEIENLTKEEILRILSLLQLNGVISIGNVEEYGPPKVIRLSISANPLINSLI